MKTKMGKYLCELAPDNPRATKDGYVYTHVLKAEEKLGRYLKPEECVHHSDLNKFNNEPYNLMVFKTISDHTAFHQGVPAVQDGDVWWCPTKGADLVCPVCFGPKDRKAPMCKKCNSEHRVLLNSNGDVVDMPSRDMLKELIRTTAFDAVGRMYGVSGNTIKKWCIKYGLPSLSHAIKLMSDDEWNSEQLSEETVMAIESYYNRTVSDDEIINAYFVNPRISYVAEQLHTAISVVRSVLLNNNIRVLNSNESGNIKITEQYAADGNKINSFLTVMDAAKWILDNGFGRNNHKTKKIAYLISQSMDTDKEVFGFLWKSNNTIEDYREYLTCKQNNIAC